MVEEYYSPRKNAEDFLANLFKYRSKSNMMSFMAFIVERLNAYNAATPQNRNYSEKFASLSVLACLADELKQNEVPFGVLITIVFIFVGIQRRTGRYDHSSYLPRVFVSSCVLEM